MAVAKIVTGAGNRLGLYPGWGEIVRDHEDPDTRLLVAVTKDGRVAVIKNNLGLDLEFENPSTTDVVVERVKTRLPKAMRDSINIATWKGR